MNADWMMETTMVFTLVVGCILGYWMVDSNGLIIVGMTAAYAAVLVVFVGSDATS
jgi:hypothetical protein